MENLTTMQCRSCASQNMGSILSLGQMPLANRLLKEHQLKEHEPKFHLEIMLCKHCGLVQLKDIVPPESLFDEYLYFSSHSATMLQSAADLIDKISLTLPKDAMIIEIASNDGYLLKNYIKKGFQVLGIEPAKNIAEYAIQQNIPTQCTYFTKDLADELAQQNKMADVIHANNVMAHVPDINNFVAGIKKLLKPTGQATIEVPYLLNLIKHCEFDTIYHEHVFYFSLLPLITLFSRHDLLIYDVETIPIHGGSLRLFVKHADDSEPSDTVQQLIKNEKLLNVTQLNFYETFSQRIHQLKDQLVALLQHIKKQGNKIAAYGASAKGSTLLNFFGIDHEIIDFIVDRNPVKQGYYMSGTRIPIYSPEILLNKNPLYTLLLTWNFAEEILKQQQSYRDQGGQFIIPIPHLEIV